MRKRLGSVIIPLIIANIVVFILQISTTKGSFISPEAIFFSPVTQYLGVRLGGLFSAPWTLVTSMFTHLSLVHILVNMWVLFMFGPVIENRIGPVRFLQLYFVSGILASLASSFIYPFAAGASGAIMGILGMAIILVPDMKVIIFPIPIPMSLRTAGIIIAALDVFGIFPGVAHVAHLAGLVCGLAFGFYLKKKKKKFYKRFHKKTHMDTKDIDEYLRSGRI